MLNLLHVVLLQQQYQNQKSCPSARYHCLSFLARQLQPPSTAFYGTKRKREKMHETKPWLGRKTSSQKETVARINHLLVQSYNSVISGESLRYLLEFINTCNTTKFQILPSPTEEYII